MDRISKSSAISAVVAIALVGTISPSVDRNLRAETVAIPENVIGKAAKDAPFVMAQGRCINGRCF
jgi:hypothetical protein